MTSEWNPEFAQRFATEWIAAWNAHDLDRVLALYTDDFAMSSPKIVQIAGDPTGTLHGKPAVRTYWAMGLKHYPDLKFELVSTLVGVNSITLYYAGFYTATNIRHAAEVFLFNPELKVMRCFAHYAI